MSVPIDLASRPIVITGASSGIGRATALECAQAGMPVVVMARRADRLEQLVSEMTSGGGQAASVAGAVEDPQACARAVELCVERFGSVYAVFANAGYGAEQDVEHMADADIRAMFEVNFYGSLNLIRPALPHMHAAGRGHVLWCSSCLSKFAVPMHAAYSATKAAQDHFARAMRLELRGTGIHVSSIHPVGTRTEFFDRIERHETRSVMMIDRMRDLSFQPPERVARAVVRCLRRPKGEVWLSTPVRLAMALGVAMPGLADALLARIAGKRQRQGMS